MRPTSLSDFTGEMRSSGNQLNFRVCPVCGSDKWKTYVDPVSGKWFCFAGQHGGGGCVDVGADADANAEGRKILDMLERPAPQTWHEIQMPPFERLSKAASRYLARRKVDVAGLGIVELTDRYRVAWPYYDDAGRLIYWNSRRYSDNLGDGPKYMAAPGRHPLYVPEYRRKPERVVLVEGAFDAWAVNAVDPGSMAVALGGKSLPRYLRKDLTRLLGFAMIKSPLVALDPDALGNAITLAVNIGGRVVDLPADPADLLVWNPELLKENLICAGT